MHRIADESFLMPWQQTFNGLTWCDMPGQDFLEKSMNLALYRRGKLDLEMDGETRKLRCAKAHFTGPRCTEKEKEEKAEAEQMRKRRRAEMHEHAQHNAAVRTQVMALRDRHVGSMRLLAELSGLHVSTVSKFVLGYKGLGNSKLHAVAKALTQIEAEPERLTRKKSTRKQVTTPPGYVPFKRWLSALAHKENTKPHTIYVQCKRGIRALPDVLKLNGRAWFVKAEEVAA